MKSNFQTLHDLIQRCIQRLSMYGGSSVQTYAEDRIYQMILDNYNLVIANFPWHTFTRQYKYTLSGNNGEVLETVSNDIADFDDIIYISPDTTDRSALRMLQTSTVSDFISGTTAIYYRRHPTSSTKIFQIIPYDAVGDIYVTANTRLNTNNGYLDPTTIIPFDADYLVYAVCADYLGDDGSSQVQYEKFSKLRDERLRQLKVLDNSATTDYNDARAYYTTTSWR